MEGLYSLYFADLTSFGGLLAGAVANSGPQGWRYIFWIEAGLHFLSSLGLLLLYHPPRRPDRPKFCLKNCIWACDPVGSGLFVLGMALLLMALNWGNGQYVWSDSNVVGCLVVGISLLAIFCLYGELNHSNYVLVQQLTKILL
jgi:hypothetical protein